MLNCFSGYVKSGILGRKNPKPKFKFYKKFDPGIFAGC